MRRYLPVLVSIAFIIALLLFVADYRGMFETKKLLLGSLNKTRSCAHLPNFLQGLEKPIVIDLTQQRFSGIAFLYGKRHHAFYRKDWARFGSFGTYTLDEQGTIFLAPMPFISIKEKTFERQKSLYRIDSDKGVLSLWKTLENVRPSASNPYGIISLVYDCENNALWVGAIDRSDYRKANGRIYRIDKQHAKITQTIKGFDALSLALGRTEDGTITLLAGSAKDGGLYAFRLSSDGTAETPEKLFELPDPKLHIRKIKVIGRNEIIVEAIPFSYALIAQTSKQYRVIYRAQYTPRTGRWNIKHVE